MTALCAISFAAAPVDAPKDTVDMFVVNGETISGFDGSVLVGETVRSYTVAFRETGDKVEKLHLIVTENAPAKKSPVIVVDGSQVTESEFTALKAEDVLSVNVYKSAVTYNGSEVENGIILVKTKDGSSEPLIYIDGKKASQKDLKALKGRIASTNFLVKDGETVIEYTTAK